MLTGPVSRSLAASQAETERTRWDGRKRAEWASSLLKAQAERARERIRWREAQEAAAAQSEEEQRRAEAKREKYGPDWDRRSSRSAGRPPDKTDPLGYFEVLHRLSHPPRPAMHHFGCAARLNAARW